MRAQSKEVADAVQENREKITRNKNVHEKAVVFNKPNFKIYKLKFRFSILNKKSEYLRQTYTHEIKKLYK